MNRRGFVKALAGLVALPSLAWAGAKQLEPMKIRSDTRYLAPVSDGFPVHEHYGRGPGFEALEDAVELKRVYMAGTSCGKTGSVESEILNRCLTWPCSKDLA